jgi:hypothetical protein
VAELPSPLVVTHVPLTNSDLVVELVEDPADPDSLVVPSMLIAAFTREYVPLVSYDDESLEATRTTKQKRRAWEFLAD